MSGRRARERRRAQVIEAVTSAGYSQVVAEHVHDNLVEPELLVERLQRQGVDAEARHVTTNPDADGVTVACLGCGATAKLPGRALRPGKGALCPACQRDRFGPA